MAASLRSRLGAVPALRLGHLGEPSQQSGETQQDTGPSLSEAEGRLLDVLRGQGTRPVVVVGQVEEATRIHRGSVLISTEIATFDAGSPLGDGVFPVGQVVVGHVVG